MKNNSFSKRMKILGAVVLFAFVAISTFSFVAPETFHGIFGCLSVSGAGSSLAFVSPLFAIQRDPSPGGGGGGETEEQKAKRLLFEEIKKKTGIDVAEFLKNDPEIASLKAFKLEIDDVKAKLAGQLSPEQIETLKSELNQALLDIKALKEVKVEVKGHKKGSIAETLAKHKGALEKFIKKETRHLEIVHKADETSTDIDGRDNFFTWHQGGAVGQIPVRKPFVRELFTNLNTNSEFVKYLDQETVVRDAKNVSLCGTTTHNTKATWKVRSMNVEKVRDFGNICLDMMNDYAFVDGEIRRLFDTSLQLKIDNNLLLQNNIAPNSNSVKAIASTFSASGTSSSTDYLAAVPFANMIDLFSIAAAQVKAFGQMNAYNPNYILINPRDLQVMKFIKDNQKNYIRNNQLFQTLFTSNGAGRYFIDGVELIENLLVPQNEAYIGDFSKGFVYARPGVGIEFAYENNDNFETETVTVKVYERLNLLVRNVDLNAFMHIADIEQGIFDISQPT